MSERSHVWGTNELPIGYYAKSFLGSPGSVKCLISEDGHSFYNTASSLLEHLDIEHPVFRYIVGVCREFRKVYGSRSTDELLFYIHSWCTVATQLNEMGIPLDDLLEEMEDSLSEIIQYVDTMKQTVSQILSPDCGTVHEITDQSVKTGLSSLTVKYGENGIFEVPHSQIHDNFAHISKDPKILGKVSKDVIFYQTNLTKINKTVLEDESQVTDDKSNQDSNHYKMDKHGVTMNIKDIDDDEDNDDDDVSWFFDDSVDRCNIAEHSVGEQVKTDNEPDKEPVHANIVKDRVDVNDELQNDDDDDVSWFFDDSDYQSNEIEHSVGETMNIRPEQEPVCTNTDKKDELRNNDNNVSLFFDDSDNQSNKTDMSSGSNDINKNEVVTVESFDQTNDDTLKCDGNDDKHSFAIDNDSSDDILEELIKLQNDIKGDIEKISKSVKGSGKSRRQRHKSGELFYINGNKHLSSKDADDNDNEFDGCFDDVEQISNTCPPSKSYSNEIKLIDSLLDRIKEHKIKQDSTRVEKESKTLETKHSKKIKETFVKLENTAQYVSAGKNGRFASNYELENILLHNPADILKTRKVNPESKDSIVVAGIVDSKGNSGMKNQQMKSVEISNNEIQDEVGAIMQTVNNTQDAVDVVSDIDCDRLKTNNTNKDETMSNVKACSDLIGSKLKVNGEACDAVDLSIPDVNRDLVGSNISKNEHRYKNQSSVSNNKLGLKLNDNFEICDSNEPFYKKTNVQICDTTRSSLLTSSYSNGSCDRRNVCDDIRQLVTCINKHHDDNVNKAVCDVVEKQSIDGKMRLDTDLIESHFIIGLYSPPYIIDGVVLVTSMAETMVLQSLQGKSCRALLINGDLKMSFKHKGYKSTMMSNISSVSSILEEISPSDQWIQDILEVLKKYSINVLLVKGVASSDVCYLCQSLDVIILDNVPYKQMSLLSEAAQCDMLTYITLASKYNVVDISSIQPLRSDWFDLNMSTNSKQDIVVNLHRNNPVTVIISECTYIQADLIDQQLWDSLYRVDVLLKHAYYIPGCGQIEEICYKFLETSPKKAMEVKNNGTKVKHLYKQPVQEYLASIFQEFSQLLTNQYPNAACIDCYKSKIKTWNVALDCVKVIMKIDCQIITGLTENLNDRTL
ncbi:Bardet-Biedl syndrome 12 [Mactra antiquata]